MGTETQQQEQQNGQGGAAGGGSAASEETPRVGQAFGTASRAPIFPSQQQAETQQQEPGANPPGGAAPPKTGRGPVSTAGIPEGALKLRLDRAQAKGAEPFLKELGVKTEAEAKEKLAKLKTAEQEAEKRRLAEMGEVERLKAELEAARQEAEALRQQLASYEQEREHEQHEQVVSRVASETIDADALPLFKLNLAQHVKQLAKTNPELAEKFGERGVKRFAEKWIAKHPKFAKAGAAAETQLAAPQKPAAAAKPATQVPPVRRPVTTGAPQRGNPPPRVTTTGAPGAMVGGKTVRPGQANSMTSAEVKAHAKSLGINYQPI